MEGNLNSLTSKSVYRVRRLHLTQKVICAWHPRSPVPPVSLPSCTWGLPSSTWTVDVYEVLLPLSDTDCSQLPSLLFRLTRTFSLGFLDYLLGQPSLANQAGVCPFLWAPTMAGMFWGAHSSHTCGCAPGTLTDHPLDYNVLKPGPNTVISSQREVSGHGLINGCRGFFSLRPLYGIIPCFKVGFLYF